MLAKIAQGFDAGIRLGDAIQQDMVSSRLSAPFKAIMVASPSYLAARGTPQTVAELATHNCIGFRLLGSGALYEWDLRDGSRDVAARTSGTAVITDATFARDLALAGVGIAYIFEPLVRADLRGRRLVQRREVLISRRALSARIFRIFRFIPVCIEHVDRLRTHSAGLTVVRGTLLVGSPAHPKICVSLPNCSRALVKTPLDSRWGFMCAIRRTARALRHYVPSASDLDPADLHRTFT